jgi:membrane-bound lytic murein transglycosylase B
MASRLLLSVALLLTACNSTDAPSARSTPEPTLAPMPTPVPTTSPQEAWLPNPDRRPPRNPRVLADDLVAVSDALKDSIRSWRREGNVDRSAPRTVRYQALYQQRIYRLMARDRQLGNSVLRLLDGPLYRFSRATVTAGERLRQLVQPVPPNMEFKIGSAEPAGTLLRFYRAAQRRFGVHWEMLAAINFVETKFGRVRSSSTAGAQGPMQFLPSTWDSYGMGGDIYDPRDAIMGAANYLSSSGAPGDYGKALYAYNPADQYVDAILLYARQMMRTSRNYLAYYNWQVFVITTSGDKRLTGPHLDGRS